MPGCVVVLTGRAFSGKSTLASSLATQLPASVVSYDEINAERGLHGGDGVAVEEWGITNGMTRDRARALLRAGQTVIVDDTSSLRFLRDQWRSLAREEGAPIALVQLDTPVPTLRRRLADNRSSGDRHDMLDDVLEKHLLDYEPPGDDEPHITVTENHDLDSAVAAIRHALRP